MARGSWTQSSFLGGEFSPSAGGRIDLPLYKTALAECLNAYPTEEGAVTRRPGTMFIQPTYGGFDGAIYPYLYNQTESIVVELTADGSGNGWIRSYANGHLVTDDLGITVTAISQTIPAAITLNTPASWATGDQIMLRVTYTGLPTTQTTMWSTLVNRQFTVTKVDTTHFQLYDMITGGAISGAPFTGSIPAIVADRVTRQSLPFNGGPQNVQYMQPILAETDLVLLNDNAGIPIEPIVLVGNANGSNIVFTVNELDFIDGPYLEYDTEDGPYTLSGTLTVGGTCTLTVTGTSQINGGAGFLATDVGRTVRVAQTYPLWNVGTSYTAGEVVSWPASFSEVQAYAALPTSGANLAYEPDTNPTYWAPIPNGVFYGWFNILTINSTTSVNGTVVGPFMGNSTSFPILAIALGVFTNTDTVWPISGAFFEGRLLLSSGQTIFGSVSAGFNGTDVVMSPTDVFGNVLDSSGFNFTLVGPGVNTIFWMHPDSASVLAGTGGSEWQIQASALGDPLTPTSFQAHQVSRLGSSYHLPQRPGIALVFVNRYSQRLIEYLADPFTSKYSGKPINIYATHLGYLGQIEYQDAPNPIIWAIQLTSSQLPTNFVSCTYRRLSYFASEMPTIYGWAKHVLGSGKTVEFIANAYNEMGTIDQLYMMTNNGSYRSVEYLLPPFSDTATLPQAQFVDSGMTGINYTLSPPRYEGIYGVSDGVGHMYFNGLYYLAGNTVALWLGGLDFGNYLVSASGTIGPVPFAADPGGIGTYAYLVAQDQGTSGADGAIPISFNESGSHSVSVPGIVGFSYTTTIKRLRPDDPIAARTQTGPGAGQLRRHHWYSLAMAAGTTGTASISGGDDFDETYPVVFYKDGAPVATNVLFQGVHSDTIDSNDDLNGQITISITRPAPFTLASWSGYIETEEL